MSFLQLKCGQRERSGWRNKATGSKQNKWKSAAEWSSESSSKTPRLKGARGYLLAASPGSVSSYLYPGWHFVEAILSIRTSYCPVPSVLAIYKSHSSRISSIFARKLHIGWISFYKDIYERTETCLQDVCAAFMSLVRKSSVEYFDRGLQWYAWSISVIFHSNLWAMVIEAQYDRCDDVNPRLTWLSL